MGRKKSEQGKITIDKEKDIPKEETPLLEDEAEEEIALKETEEEKSESEEEVDISEVEDNVAEDEDGNLVVEAPLEEEEEIRRTTGEVDTEDDEASDEEGSYIKQKKNVEEVGSSAGKIQVSKEQFGKTIERLQFLRSVGRKEIAEKLKIAREFGDLSENSEYEAAKKDQAFVEGEISDLEQRMEKMEIMDFYRLTDEMVHIGNVVQTNRMKDGKIFNVQIVGSSYESDVNCRPMKIAIDSPVGSGLLGFGVGGMVRIKLPHNKMAVFQVLSISH
jgi:transcription elongation factor GreA